MRGEARREVAEVLRRAGVQTTSASADSRGNAMYSTCFGVGMYSVQSCAWAPSTRLAASGLSSAGIGSYA